ncbi:MAG: hypothetical protein Q7R92_04550 [bacterium]|nr:hypothetical protein [bacterium]
MKAKERQWPKILFICAGNVARSQMAEAYYNSFTNSRAGFSAGVLAFTPLKYGQPAEEAIQAMTEDGLDISQNKVKYITEKMVRQSDKVIIMCRQEQCPEFLLKSSKITFWPVDDPYGTDLDNFRKIRDAIKAKVILLINKQPQS